MLMLDGDEKQAFDEEQRDLVTRVRDVGSISNLGRAQRFEGTFSLRKRGIF